MSANSLQIVTALLGSNDVDSDRFTATETDLVIDQFDMWTNPQRGAVGLCNVCWSPAPAVIAAA